MMSVCPFASSPCENQIGTAAAKKKVHLITFFGELAKTEMSAEMSAEVEQNWPEGGLILERQDPQNWH